MDSQCKLSMSPQAMPLLFPLPYSQQFEWQQQEPISFTIQNIFLPSYKERVKVKKHPAWSTTLNKMQTNWSSIPASNMFLFFFEKIFKAHKLKLTAVNTPGSVIGFVLTIYLLFLLNRLALPCFVENPTQKENPGSGDSAKCQTQLSGSASKTLLVTELLPRRTLPLLVDPKPHAQRKTSKAGSSRETGGFVLLGTVDCYHSKL